MPNFAVSRGRKSKMEDRTFTDVRTMGGPAATEKRGKETVAGRKNHSRIRRGREKAMKKPTRNKEATGRKSEEGGAKGRGEENKRIKEKHTDGKKGSAADQVCLSQEVKRSYSRREPAGTFGHSVKSRREKRKEDENDPRKEWR